jgi:hypothetical protein
VEPSPWSRGRRLEKGALVIVTGQIREGDVLLHIGVHKTATTAIQSALTSLRPELAAHGVTLPLSMGAQLRAARAVVDSPIGFGADRDATDLGTWHDLLRKLKQGRVDAPRNRQVVSAEDFCMATAEQVDHIVGSMEQASCQVHVVVTLRPLGSLFPSAWQQSLKSGQKSTYEEWLARTLDPGPRTSPHFARRYRHGELVQRWVDRVGPERVTVVVLDPRDRDLVFRTFGDMLALPAGLLSEEHVTRENRSLTRHEAEFFRRVNLTLRDVGLPWAHYSRLIRFGAAPRTIRAQPLEQPDSKVWTPQWALDVAQLWGQETVQGIRAAGAQVVGDLDSLARQTQAGPPPTSPVETIGIDVAVQALLGAVAGSVEGRSWFSAEPSPDGSRVQQAGVELSPTIPPSTPVGALTTKQLTRVVASRVRRGLRRRAYRVARLPRRRTH